MLADIVENTPVQPTSPPETDSTSSRLFCPRCRHVLKKAITDREDWALQCPQCGVALGKVIIYQLIELHPHQ
ncbi:MAG: hypothetical protein ABIR47_10860 [Candidatus Kapaibacterium sp.]